MRNTVQIIGLQARHKARKSLQMALWRRSQHRKLVFSSIHQVRELTEPVVIDMQSLPTASACASGEIHCRSQHSEFRIFPRNINSGFPVLFSKGVRSPVLSDRCCNRTPQKHSSYEDFHNFAHKWDGMVGEFFDRSYFQCLC